MEKKDALVDVRGEQNRIELNRLVAALVLGSGSIYSDQTEKRARACLHERRLANARALNISFLDDMNSNGETGTELFREME